MGIPDSRDQMLILEKAVSDFLMEQNSEPILILNPDFTISQANEAFLNRAKKSAKEVIGSFCYKIIYGYAVPCCSAHPQFECPVIETMRTGESAHVIHEDPILPNGASFSNVVSYPIKDEKGDVVKIIEIWQDITRELNLRWEKRAQQIRDDINALVHEDRLVSLGKLAASCVHEINNPIQGLLTFSQLIEKILAKEDLDQQDILKMRSHASLMTTELERCGGIVSGLLSFARENPREFADIRVGEVLSTVLALTRHKMTLQNITVDENISDKALRVRGNRHQLQQCFLNILFNAMDAMPEGGCLTINTAVDRLKGKARIEFHDTGRGIEENDLPNLLDPFFTTKPQGGGTGLGLSIVYGIVKSHGGDILVSNKPGGGTVFVLEFPLLDAS